MNNRDDDEEEDDEYGNGYDDMGRPGYDNRNPFDNRSSGRNGRGGNLQTRQMTNARNF